MQHGLASDDVKKYIVEYTVGDETKTMTVTDNKCSLGDFEQFTEGTTVTVTTVGKDDDEHVHAKGSLKPDLIISSVSTPSNAYGVGDVIPITVTMKNVGLGVAKPNGNNNMTVKPTKDGKIIEFKYC